MIRRHSSSTAWRSESMASSSATTRSACSRSAVEQGLGAGTDGVEGQRCQAHDVEAHVVDAFADVRIRLVGHDLRGDHAVIMVVLTSASVAFHPLFPALFTFVPPRRHGASTVPSYAPRRTHDHVHVPGGTPTCSVRSLVAAGSCSPRWRCRCCSSATPRQPPRRPQAKLASATLNGDGSTFQLGFNQVVHRRRSSSSRRP